MEVSKVRELQEDLENEIQELLENFEEETGTMVNHIEIDKIDTRTFDAPQKRYKNFINQVNITIQL